MQHWLNELLEKKGTDLMLASFLHNLSTAAGK
jgi:hypothetical protein